MAGLIQFTISVRTPEASISYFLQVRVLEALTNLLILFKGMQAMLDIFDC